MHSVESFEQLSNDPEFSNPKYFIWLSQRFSNQLDITSSGLASQDWMVSNRNQTSHILNDQLNFLKKKHWWSHANFIYLTSKSWLCVQKHTYIWDNNLFGLDLLWALMIYTDSSIAIWQTLVSFPAFNSINWIPAHMARKRLAIILAGKNPRMHTGFDAKWNMQNA